MRFLFAFSTFLVLSLGATYAEWSLMTSGVPDNRFGHSVIWTGSEMIIWGGVSQDHYLSDGCRYDPQQDRWIPVSQQQAPSARGGHTTIWTGQEMIVWGGFAQNGTALNDGGR